MIDLSEINKTFFKHRFNIKILRDRYIFIFKQCEIEDYYFQSNSFRFEINGICSNIYLKNNIEVNLQDNIVVYRSVEMENFLEEYYIEKDNGFGFSAGYFDNSKCSIFSEKYQLDGICKDFNSLNYSFFSNSFFLSFECSSVRQIYNNYKQMDLLDFEE